MIGLVTALGGAGALGCERSDRDPAPAAEAGNGESGVSVARSARGDRPRADTAAPPPVAGDGRRTILFVGTSLTAGLGIGRERAFPALIQRRLDSAGLSYRVVNAGESGETSAGALRRLDWLLRQPLDVFVLETGANDGLRGLGVDSMRANIQAILDRAKRAHPSAKLFVVAMEAPPNLGEAYTSSFRGVYPELAARNGATLVPFLLDGVAGRAELNQDDGMHPNIEGERIVAETVWRALRPTLEARRLD